MFDVYLVALKKAGRKYPNHLADSCKRSSVNRMAAGSRLSWCIMDFFSSLQLFKHTVQSSTSLAGCRTWCPTDLQHLCCKALIINKYSAKMDLSVQLFQLLCVELTQRTRLRVRWTKKRLQIAKQSLENFWRQQVAKRMAISLLVAQLLTPVERLWPGD